MSLAVSFHPSVKQMRLKVSRGKGEVVLKLDAVARIGFLEPNRNPKAEIRKKAEVRNLKLCSWALFIALRVSAFFRASRRAITPSQQAKDPRVREVALAEARGASWSAFPKQPLWPWPRRSNRVPAGR